MTAKDDAPDAWSARGVARAAVIAAVAWGAGAAAGYALAHEPAPHENGPSPSSGNAGQAELAILAPLREGSTLDGYDVTQIHRVHDGVLSISCRTTRAGVRLDVGLASAKGAMPPAVAGRYAVFYALGTGATSDDGEHLAQALAKILETNANAPTPPGLSEIVRR
jgi:hypothetical protein